MRNYNDCLLDPEKSVVVIIDHQPQMYFGIESSPRATILNNVTALAKAAQLFNVPCVLTTIEAQTFSGNLLSKIQGAYPTVTPIDRTAINAWEDANFKAVIESFKRKKVILAGLWTEACVTFPALSMMHDGYNVYFVSDACGGASQDAHNMAVNRMIQAGAVPTTWQQVMLEWQRDWANKDTYDGVMTIIKEHSGAYGMGVEYCETMVKKQ